jgi:hypothetical protein
MTAAAIATMATVEAATITAVSCPFACSRKRKRRDLNPPWPLDELQRAVTAANGCAPRLRSNVREGTARIRVEPAVHAIVSRCDATQDGFRALLSSPNLKRR